jgi:hypothetical protein
VEYTYDSPQNRVVVPIDILQSAGLTERELDYHLGKLFSYDCGFQKLIPSKIEDSGLLRWFVDLAQRLEKLSHCKGFDIHIGRYTNQRDAKSAYDVAIIATYLIDKADKIELEPAIEGEKYRADILVNKNGEDIYLECKSIDTRQFGYLDEHFKMFSVLRKHITTPHQIDMKYVSSLSDAELAALGREINERLRHVTTSGCIINNSNLEVSVLVRVPNQVESGGPLGVMLGGTLQHEHDQCFYPWHVFMEDNLKLSLSGPKVDFNKILRRRLGKSRRQAPSSKPYILMINCNNMLGSWSENIRAITTAFQPSRNTRFSATVLFTYINEPAKGLRFQFEVISNPFTKAVVSEAFKGLFTSSLSDAH